MTKCIKICLASFGRFSGIFPAFTCAGSIDNLYNNCFGGNILSLFPWVDLNGEDIV